MIQTHERKKSLRKIAILIQTLDEAEADRLLEQMTLEQAADVREMAESLDDVGDAERLTVVNEFLRATGRKPLPELASQSNATMTRSDGVELELSAASRGAAASRSPTRSQLKAHETDSIHQHARHVEPTFAGPNSVVNSAARSASREHQAEPEAQRDERPLAFIQPGHASVVAEWMIGERESVGVVVLGLLPPVIAARVLEQLPFERQRVLLGKLAELRRVEPEVIAELQRILRLVVDDCPPQGEVNTGHAAVQAILQQVQAAHRARLVPEPNHMPQERSQANVRFEPPTRSSQASRPAPTGAEIEPSHAPRPMVSTPSMPLRVLPESRPNASPISARPVERSEVPTTRMAPPRSASIRSAPATDSHDVAPTLDAASSETTKASAVLPLEQQRLIATRFEELVTWSEPELIDLFKRIPPRLSRLALVGTSESLVAKVLRPLRRDEATRWRQMIERPGSVRLSDIAQAQLMILRVAEEILQTTE